MANVDEVREVLESGHTADDQTTLRCRLFGHKRMPTTRFISMEEGFGGREVCLRAGCGYEKVLY